MKARSLPVAPLKNSDTTLWFRQESQGSDYLLLRRETIGLTSWTIGREQARRKQYKQQCVPSGHLELDRAMVHLTVSLP